MLSRRLVPTVVLVGLLYANTSSILETAGIPIDPPRTWYVKHLFRMFRVFSRTTERVYGYEARARLARALGDDGPEVWIELDPYAFFPQAGGEPNRRLSLSNFPQRTAVERARRQTTYREMVQRMKALHTRWHPEQPIDRIQLFYLTWPKSEDGYRSHIDEAERRLVIDE